MPLTGKQKRYLRSLGHSLQAVVHIGKDGVSDSLVDATKEALISHELIKLKLGQNCLLDRKEAAAQLAQATNSEVAQVLGGTILLYREREDDPTIVLPKAAMLPKAAVLPKAAKQ